MSAPSWETAEPGYAFARAETGRLLRRARKRIVWVLLIATLGTAGFVGRRLLRPGKHEASIAMRVVEADLDLTEALRPSRDYLHYIWAVFFSGPNLTKIIERHHLYADKYARDPRLAVEAFRDDLEVEVWRNYFMWEHYDNDNEARTVRFSVMWPARDPQLALDVVRELGETIIAAQTEERRQIFELGQRDLADAADEAAQRLLVVRREAALRRQEQGHAKAARQARLGVELRDLEEEEKGQQHRVEELGNARSRFELTAAWEHQRSGLRFEWVDPGVVKPPPGGGRKALISSAVLVFAGVALMAAMVLGAFEPRVRFPDDVTRLGLPLLGAIPRFAGDDVGTLRERLHTEDRLRLEER